MIPELFWRDKVPTLRKDDKRLFYSQLSLQKELKTKIAVSVLVECGAVTVPDVVAKDGVRFFWSQESVLLSIKMFSETKMSEQEMKDFFTKKRV